MKINRHSLYFRISRVFLLLLLLLSVAQIFALYLTVSNFNDKRLQFTNWSLAEKLVPRFQQEFAESGSYYSILRLAQQVNESNPNIDIHIVNEEGKVVANLASFGGGAPGYKAELGPIKEFLKGYANSSLPIYGTDPNYRGSTRIFSAAKMSLGNATYYLYIILSNTRYQAANAVIGENTAALYSVVLFFGSIVAVGALGVMIFCYLTRKFSVLTETVTNFRKTNFSARVPFESKDEVGLLASAFNEMADTLEQNFRDIEQRDNTRRELIAAISHDLRGPVAILSGYSDKLRAAKSIESQNGGKIPETSISEIGETIYRAANSLSHLLHELFELAKLEAKDKKLNLSLIFLDEIVHNVVDDFKMKASDLEVELRAECSHGLQPVMADVQLIERALVNLVDNAIRYTPAKGVVVLRAWQENNKIEISVSDTGMGIPEADLPYIFEKFHSAKGNQPRQGQSSGLGLAIVKKIIEAHDTEITAKSQVGQGTTFSFSLNTADIHC